MSASVSQGSIITKGNKALILERFAPYRIVALGHAISRSLENAYSGEDLSIPEWRVLAVVAQKSAVAARDVVQRTPMDKMTVSRATVSLENKGIICRTPSEEDRRMNMLSLTEKGQAVFDRIAVVALNYEEEVLSVLDDEERALFDKALSKLERRTGAASVREDD